MARPPKGVSLLPAAMVLSPPCLSLLRLRATALRQRLRLQRRRRTRGL